MGNQNCRQQQYALVISDTKSAPKCTSCAQSHGSVAPRGALRWRLLAGKSRAYCCCLQFWIPIICVVMDYFLLDQHTTVHYGALDIQKHVKSGRPLWYLKCRPKYILDVNPYTLWGQMHCETFCRRYNTLPQKLVVIRYLTPPCIFYFNTEKNNRRFSDHFKIFLSIFG